MGSVELLLLENFISGEYGLYAGSCNKCCRDIKCGIQLRVAHDDPCTGYCKMIFVLVTER